MSFAEFMQLMIIMFWWLPTGLCIRGLQILQDKRRTESDE